MLSQIFHKKTKNAKIYALFSFNMSSVDNNCSVCLLATATAIQLCEVGHPGSEPCVPCAIRLVQSGHERCPTCRRNFPPQVAAELGAAAANNHTPFVTPLQNVRAAMYISPAESRPAVRRRLDYRVPTDTIDDYQQSASPMCGRPCTDLINYSYEGMRFDTMTAAERFVFTNGVRIPQGETLGFTGYAIVEGCIYKSTNQDHLPPIVQGPLFNNMAKAPAWARQHIAESKLFYARDQLVRNYKPWLDGHRPVDSRYNAATARSTTTALFSTTIKVTNRYLYQTYEPSGIFESLAYAFADDCRLIPTLRSLGVDADRCINISPVYCTRSRPHALLDYAEFDMVCALSYRKEGHRWRSGPLLFLTYRRVVNQWEITRESKAVFPSPNSPAYSPDMPFLGLVDNIVAYYNNLP